MTFISSVTQLLRCECNTFFVLWMCKWKLSIWQCSTHSWVLLTEICLSFWRQVSSSLMFWVQATCLFWICTSSCMPGVFPGCIVKGLLTFDEFLIPCNVKKNHIHASTVFYWGYAWCLQVLPLTDALFFGVAGEPKFDQQLIQFLCFPHWNPWDRARICLLLIADFIFKNENTFVSFIVIHGQENKWICWQLRILCTWCVLFHWCVALLCQYPIKNVQKSLYLSSVQQCGTQPFFWKWT